MHTRCLACNDLHVFMQGVQDAIILIWIVETTTTLLELLDATVHIGF
jgi:hypothetical protein